METKKIMETRLERVFGYSSTVNTKAIHSFENGVPMYWDKKYGKLLPIIQSPAKKLTIEQLYNDLKRKPTGKLLRLKELCKYYRSQGIEKSVFKKYDEYKSLKNSLPVYTISGFQMIGRDNENMQYNGTLQVDLDLYSVDIAKKVFETLKGCEFIELLGISPSDDGVKGTVLTNNLNKEYHLAVVDQMNDKIKEYLLKNGDEEIKELVNSKENNPFDRVSLSQPCYIFNSEDVYYNPNSKIFEFDSKKVVKNERNKKDKGHINIKQTEINLSKEEIEEVFDMCYERTIKEVGEVKSGNRNKFARFITPLLYSNGISLENALEQFKRVGQYQDNFIIEHFEPIYNNHNNKKDTIFGEKVEEKYDINNEYYDFEADYEEESSLINEHNEKYKSNEKYLTEILPIDVMKKNNLIIANTGLGKTTFFLKGLNKKTIFIFPLNGLIEQIAKEYKNADIFNGKIKTANKNSEIILTTYDSFPTLFKQLGEKEINNFRIVLDEAHNFVTSSSLNYKNAVMNNLKYHLDLCVDKHFITATPLKCFSNIFENLNVIKVETPQKIKVKKFNVLRTNSKFKGVKEMIKKIRRNDKKQGKKPHLFAIYLQNTQEIGALGILTQIFQDLNISTKKINSKTKDTQDYKDIVIDGIIDSSTELVVFTSAFKEGISTRLHHEYKKVSLFLLDNTCITEIEQIGNRFRNCETLDVYDVVRYDYQNVDTIGKYASFKWDVERSVELAENYLMSQLSVKSNEVNREDNSYLKTILKKMDNNLPEYIRFNHYTNTFERNELLVSNILFEYNKNLQNLNLSYKFFLAKKLFGFVVGQTTDILVSLTEKEKNETQAMLELKKEIKDGKIDEVIDAIKLEDEKSNLEKYEEIKLSDDVENIEFKIRQMFLKLLKCNISYEQCVEIIKEVRDNTKSFNNIYEKIKIKAYKQRIKIREKQTKVQNQVNKIYEVIKIGNKYTSKEILDIFKPIFKEETDICLTSSITERIAIQYLNMFFETKRTKVDKNNVYVIVSDDPISNIQINNVKEGSTMVVY